MPSAAVVNALAEFYSAEEIRGFRKQCLAALAGRSTEILHINALSEDGQSSTGIALSSPEEIEDFMNACEAAERRLAGSTDVDPDDLGTGKDFSYRMVDP